MGMPHNGGQVVLRVTMFAFPDLGINSVSVRHDASYESVFVMASIDHHSIQSIINPAQTTAPLIRICRKP